MIIIRKKDPFSKFNKLYRYIDLKNIFSFNSWSKVTRKKSNDDFNAFMHINICR